VTRANLKGTQGCPIRTRGTVVGIGRVFGRADIFAITNLFDWYRSTLLTHWPRIVLQST
jgi:hypothetical protein